MLCRDRVKPPCRNHEKPRRPKKSPPASPKRPQRANDEAEARRAAQKPQNLPPEQGGPKGPEPTRYGDWEKKGLISDF